MGEIHQTYNGQVGFGKNMVATVSRSGDLISHMYNSYKLPAVTYDGMTPFAPPNDVAYYTNAIGYASIDHARCEIGGHTFDKQYGYYMQAWDDLAAPPEKLLREMTGNYDTIAQLVDAARQDQYIYAPFKFWWNRFYEQALPLIALQYHEVKIYVNMNSASDLEIRSGAFITNPDDVTFSDPESMELLINYVFLDTMERRMFAQQAHEYLIDQVQYTGAVSHTSATGSDSIRLIFNHPVQELIWLCQRNDVVDGTDPSGKDYFNWSGNLDTNGLPTDAFTTAHIDLNGHQRTLDHEAFYYRQVQPYEHHSRLPRRYVYHYSFALYPEDVKPSGTCNMSRIDNCNIIVSYPNSTTLKWDGNVYIYARNKNVCKIVSGMAGTSPKILFAFFHRDYSRISLSSPRVGLMYGTSLLLQGFIHYACLLLFSNLLTWFSLYSQLNGIRTCYSCVFIKNLLSNIVIPRTP